MKAENDNEIEEVKKMRKFYKILMILGSLIGIAATVRW